jgi:hypothetical protein
MISKGGGVAGNEEKEETLISTNTTSFWEWSMVSVERFYVYTFNFLETPPPR